MPSKVADPGLHLLDRITEWAREHSVPLVNGHVPVTITVPSISLTVDEDTDGFGQLFAVLEQVSPYLIVSELIELGAEDIDDSVEKLLARDADTEELDATRACSKFVGQVASLDIHVFIKDGPVLLDYTYVAPWNQAAYPDDSEDGDSGNLVDPEEAARMRAEREDRENQYRAAQEERNKWTAAARSDAARRIAADPRFPKAKTEAGRVLITRDVLGPDIPSDDYMVKEISREAKAVFDFEIALNR